MVVDVFRRGCQEVGLAVMQGMIVDLANLNNEGGGVQQGICICFFSSRA